MLNVGGFYDLLWQFLAHAQDSGFLTAEHLGRLTVSDDVEAMLDLLLQTPHTLLPKPIHLA